MLKGIYAINKDVVFVRGEFATARSVLLRSEDGGQHWQEVMMPLYGSSVLGVTFKDNEGWALVAWTQEAISDLHVYYSPDYGRTWEKVSKILNDRGRPYGMKFFDGQNGQIKIIYAIANPYRDRLAILATNDGGVTWQETNSTPIYKEWDGESNPRIAIDLTDRTVIQAQFARLAGWEAERGDSCFSICETVGQDGSRWQLLHGNGYDNEIVIRRSIQGESVWTTVSTIPSRYYYLNGKITRE